MPVSACCSSNAAPYGSFFSTHRSCFVLLVSVLFSLELEFPPGTEDDQQGREHFPSGSSRAVHDQLHRVTDLWLVQLPFHWQDVPAQHPRHSTQSQLGRHCRRRRLALVQHPVHWTGLVSCVIDHVSLLRILSITSSSVVYKTSCTHYFAYAAVDNLCYIFLFRRLIYINVF